MQSEGTKRAIISHYYRPSAVSDAAVESKTDARLALPAYQEYELYRIMH